MILTNRSCTHVLLASVNSMYISLDAISLHRWLRALFVLAQFYSWYYHTLPFLLWQTDLPVMGRLAVLAGIEISFNIFPATSTSSAVLQVTNERLSADFPATMETDVTCLCMYVWSNIYLKFSVPVQTDRFLSC